MIRTVRLSAALLLVGIALVSMPGVVAAENTPWEFDTSVDPLTDEPAGLVVSIHVSGGLIGFGCSKRDAKGDSIAQFVAIASTQQSDRYPKGGIEVAWRTDNGAIHNEVWEANSISNEGAVKNSGQPAVRFARAVMEAQNRVVFRNPNGTIVFDANDSTKAILQLFELCGLDR